MKVFSSISANICGLFDFWVLANPVATAPPSERPKTINFVGSISDTLWRKSRAVIASSNKPEK